MFQLEKVYQQNNVTFGDGTAVVYNSSAESFVSAIYYEYCVIYCVLSKESASV